MSAAPAVGEKAPAFALQSTSGETVRLADLAGQWVVLYFYPKDDTPGCTKEACSFQAHLPQLARLGAKVFGVSKDTVDSHQRFSKKFSLTFPLLCDADGMLCDAYGVFKKKSMYGRSFMGIERTTFVINPQGRIAHVFPKVSVDGHTEAVLQALRDATASAGQTPRASSGAR